MYSNVLLVEERAISRKELLEPDLGMEITLYDFQVDKILFRTLSMKSRNLVIDVSTLTEKYYQGRKQMNDEKIWCT